MYIILTDKGITDPHQCQSSRSTGLCMPSQGLYECFWVQTPVATARRQSSSIRSRTRHFPFWCRRRAGVSERGSWQIRHRHDHWVLLHQTSRCWPQKRKSASMSVPKLYWPTKRKGNTGSIIPCGPQYKPTTMRICLFSGVWFQKTSCCIAQHSFIKGDRGRMGKKTEAKHSLDCEEVCTGSDHIAFLVKYGSNSI